MKNERLFKLMMKSKRYENIKVGYPKLAVDKKTLKQFYAATFVLPNRIVFISYRGTDVTINGWKEDLVIAYQEGMPAQKDAVEYFKNAISLFKGQFYLGGHSKGGNLAFYSAMTMNKSLEKRLIKAYSFDGPGIRKELSSFPAYERVRPKLTKYITGNDMIGVVYNKIPEAKIVFSPGILLGGHDVFAWQVDLIKGDFIYMKDRSAFSKGHEEALMKWLVEMSDEDKKLAVDVLTQFFGESKTIYDLLLNASRNLMFRKKEWEAYTPEQKEKAKEIFKRLAKYYLEAYSPKRFLNIKLKKSA